MSHLVIFVSAATTEFAPYREHLRRNLTSPNVKVDIQEDFKPFGFGTLCKLDEYIRNSGAVIHLAGAIPGATPNEAEVAELCRRYPERLAEPALAAALSADPPVTYTQWEAYLALFHQRALFLCTPSWQELSTSPQRTHLERLQVLGRYADLRFSDPKDLALQLFQAGLHELLPTKGTTQFIGLPYPSIHGLYKKSIPPSLTALGPQRGIPVVLHGPAGIGKTRTAVELALRTAGAFSHVIFLSAYSPEDLQESLASLAGPEGLSLPRSEAWCAERRETEARNWLRDHREWLCIIDNVDTRASISAVLKLLKQIQTGTILITSRIATWAAGLRPVEVSQLPEQDATDYLLERTNGCRVRTADDAALARQLVRDLDGLPLALDHAASFICAREIGLAEYRRRWIAGDTRVRNWYDEQLMCASRKLATTWDLTFTELRPPARALLRILCWLEPGSIEITDSRLTTFRLRGDVIRQQVDSLRAASELEHAVQSMPEEERGDATQLDADVERALAELRRYSLAKVNVATGRLHVHCSVVDITRARLTLDERLHWREVARRFIANCLLEELCDQTSERRETAVADAWVLELCHGQPQQLHQVFELLRTETAEVRHALVRAIFPLHDEPSTVEMRASLLGALRETRGADSPQACDLFIGASLLDWNQQEELEELAQLGAQLSGAGAGDFDPLLSGALERIRTQLARVIDPATSP